MAKLSTRLVTILGFLAAAIVMLLAASQTWLTAKLLAGLATVDEITATGNDLSKVFVAGALLIAVGALALTLFKRWVRYAVLVLLLLAAIGVLLSALFIGIWPLREMQAPVSEVTALSGEAALYAIAGVKADLWPWVTVCAAAVAFVAALYGLATCKHWSQAGRKYERATQESAAQRTDAQQGDRISDWDALSQGADPTVD